MLKGTSYVVFLPENNNNNGGGGRKLWEMMDCLCLDDGDGFMDVYLSQAHQVVYIIYIYTYTTFYMSIILQYNSFKKRDKGKAHALGDCA